MIRKASVRDVSTLMWFKSSYSSSGDGNDCIEVAMTWFKSSYSGGNDGNSCVEIAITPATVHVRDSKTTDGPRLTLTPNAWTQFLAYAAEG